MAETNPKPKATDTDVTMSDANAKPKAAQPESQPKPKPKPVTEAKTDDNDVKMSDNNDAKNDDNKDDTKDNESKTETVNYTLSSDEIILDQTTITDKDIKSKNISTSYTTTNYDGPGSLTLKEFKYDDNNELISIIFDVIAPAKNVADKTKIDNKNTYTVNVSKKERELTEGNWLPLESNPDALTKFCRRMGLPTKYSFTDFIPDFMAMYNDVRAAVLLFPSGHKNIVAFKKEQMQALTKKKQKLSKNIFYLYQHDKIGNACGTIALLHALANSGIKLDKIKNKNGDEVISPIEEFVTKTKKMNFTERGWELLKATNIQEVSEDTAEDVGTNQTSAPTKDDQNVDGHFCAFAIIDGDLYELDGRKKFPINHGKCDANSFLKDAYNVVKTNFMNKAQDNPNFVFLPLCIPPF